MSVRDIDEYLEALGEPHRATLEELRRRIVAVIPEAEQSIAYNLPAFKVDGRAVAGFGAFKSHLSYFPHSGSVLSELPDELASYEMSKGALRFAVDTPLPKSLVKKLIAVRLRQIRGARADGPPTRPAASPLR